MKKLSLISLIGLCVVLLSISLIAQQRTGNIFGRVVDNEGNPLPGVTVTLTGTYTAPLTTVTSAEGVFRFLSLSPANDYSIKLELTGFKTKIEGNIVVAVGVNTNLTLVMEPGVIEEEITVTAVTPVVDPKKTTVSVNVTHVALQSLPTARDPWVFLRMVPGTVADREDVGGTDTGHAVHYNCSRSFELSPEPVEYRRGYGWRPGGHRRFHHLL